MRISHRNAHYPWPGDSAGDALARVGSELPEIDCWCGPFEDHVSCPLHGAVHRGGGDQAADRWGLAP